MFVRFAALLLAGSSQVVAQDTRPKALLSANDYPAEAIRLGQQGEVRVRLKVSAEGRVTGCAVTQSAGSSLDRATCRIMQQRARFRPATDADGKAIVSEFDAPPIRWVLPPGKPAPPQGVRL